MDTLRDRLRRWMTDTMQIKQWSAERWGKEAGTAPTNITRFLKSGSAPIPTMRTLEKLAQAAQVPVPSQNAAKLPLGSIPIIDVTTIRMVHFPAEPQEIRAMLKRSVGDIRAPFRASDAAFAVVAPTDRLEIMGILPGDFLVVEPNEEQSRGSVLLYKTPTGDLDIGVLESGMLMPRCAAPVAAVPAASVEIVGRVMQHVRKL